MQTKLLLAFFSDWHVSSGLGDSYRADAVLVRDADGFPYVPGRALKGALREGARRLGLCRQDLRNAEAYFWGTRQDSVESNEPGRIRVSAAELPGDLKHQINGLSGRERLINDLTVVRSQTALTAAGVAKASSLRSIECGMAGLELAAELSVSPGASVPEEWVTAYFTCVCAAVKSIGGNRSRGFGRCVLSMAGQNGTPDLPPELPFLTTGGAA